MVRYLYKYSTKYTTLLHHLIIVSKGSYCYIITYRFLELCIELPLTTFKWIRAYRAYMALTVKNALADKIQRHNVRVQFRKASLNELKRVVEFFHASQLAFDWPTSSKAQDAICGFIAASISLYKLTNPRALSCVVQPKPE